MTLPLWLWLWTWIANVYSAAYAAAFDGSLSFGIRFLAMLALMVLLMAPCAAFAAAVRALTSAMRRLIHEQEQKHPLVLVGFGGEFARALARDTHVRDEVDPSQMSFDRLDAALEASEKLLHHARTIRQLDKDRRKHSWLLRLVDVTTHTREQDALRHAVQRHKELQQHAQQRARAFVQDRTLVLATASKPELGARHKALSTEAQSAKQQAARATEWERLARQARDAMLAAKRQCESASTTELFDLFTKNKAFAVWSTLDSQSAGSAVDKAQRAVAALRRTLPDRRTLDVARIPIPGDFFDLVVDLTLAPRWDIISWMNISKLHDVAARCGRAADKLDHFADRAAELAASAQAAARDASAAIAAIEAPFAQAARAEIPERLAELI